MVCNGIHCVGDALAQLPYKVTKLGKGKHLENDFFPPQGNLRLVQDILTRLEKSGKVQGILNQW